MIMTQEELDLILKRNPAIRVKNLRRCSTRSLSGNIPATAETASALVTSAKYWNLKVFVQEKGITVKKADPALGKVIEKYDSLKEYRRNSDLQLLQKSGQISNLRRQVPILIQDGFAYGEEKIAPIFYRADFTYTDLLGHCVVEDVKGYDEKRCKYLTTKDFVLKWKLLKFRYPSYTFKIY